MSVCGLEILQRKRSVLRLFRNIFLAVSALFDNVITVLLYRSGRNIVRLLRIQELVKGNYVLLQSHRKHRIGSHRIFNGFPSRCFVGNPD